MANHVYGYIRVSSAAQNERESIRRRQAEGIAAAKGRGVKFGRPPRPLPDGFDDAYRAWKDKKMTLRQAAEACEMPAGTFYSKAVKLEKEHLRKIYPNFDVKFCKN